METAFVEWPAWVGLPLAALIVFSPVACLILFVLSLNRTRTPSFKRKCAIAVFVLPLFALLLYAIYELGVSDEANIRIDLLLIYPALVLDFLFWIALFVRYVVSNRR